MTALKTAIFERWQDTPEANPLNKDNIAMYGNRKEWSYRVLKPNNSFLLGNIMKIKFPDSEIFE